jgi:hypothetical protein
MSILTIIITLAVLGLVLWLLYKLPIDPQIKEIMKWVVIAVVVIWLLKVFGLWTYLANVSV